MYLSSKYYNKIHKNNNLYFLLLDFFKFFRGCGYLIWCVIRSKNQTNR